MTIDWTNITVKLSDLKPWSDNPRQSTKAQAKKLLKSWDQFGQVETVAVGPDYQVYDGHQRLSALLAVHGADYVIDARQASRALSDDERRRLVVTLHAGAVGEWDWDKLSSWQPAELMESGFDADLLKEWKRDTSALQNFLNSEKSEPVDAEPQIDKAEELRVKWGVETGQLWQLGEHRLICGDCTDAAVVARVMGGEKARLCFTSPPYGNLRDYKSGDFDYMDLYKRFSNLSFSICDDVLVNLGLIHNDGGVFRYWEEWLNYCESSGNKLFGWYVWDQLSGMPGDYHGRLARSFEWVFHFSKSHIEANKWIPTTGESLLRGTEGKRFRQKDGSLKQVGSPDTIGQLFKIPDNVIRIRREMARGVHTESHPATFPVEFIEFGIQTWSLSDDIVYEPFSGSGTTIVACENLSRKCRAVEISPAYVAVALERWATATGKTPVLISDTDG